VRPSLAVERPQPAKDLGRGIPIRPGRVEVDAWPHVLDRSASLARLEHDCNGIPRKPQVSTSFGAGACGRAGMRQVHGHFDSRRQSAGTKVLKLLVGRVSLATTRSFRLISTYLIVNKCFTYESRGRNQACTGTLRRGNWIWYYFHCRHQKNPSNWPRFRDTIQEIPE
jgi:hypothetical protein